MKISDYRISMESTSTTRTSSQTGDFSSFLKTRYAAADRSSSRSQFQGSSSIQLVGTSIPANVKFTQVEVVAVTQKPEESDYIEVDMKDFDLNKMIAIQRQLEALTGKQVRFHIPRQQVNQGTLEDYIVFVGRAQLAGANDNQHVLAGSSLQTHGSESTSFKSEGNVKTEDGRSIDLDLELNLSRQHVQQPTSSNKVDPLILNLDTDSAELSDTKINFDINSDGKTENISFVGKGSGFLAMDLDGDNKITNGRELFGATTGDGFGELASYDNDKNNWIDENDEVYEKLRIWRKNDQGVDSLRGLKAEGVGAIFLGSAKTNFSLTGASNKENGALTDTGIFLKENGTVGTVQNVDLTV